MFKQVIDQLTGKIGRRSGKLEGRGNPICSFDVLRRKAVGIHWELKRGRKRSVSSYLDNVPVRHHFRKTLCHLGTGGSKQHHHSSRVLRVEGVKESVHSHTWIALRKTKGKSTIFLSINKLLVVLLSEVLLFLALPAFNWMSKSSSLECCRFYWRIE